VIRGLRRERGDVEARLGTADAVRERLVRELPARVALGLAASPAALASLIGGPAGPDQAAAELATDLCGAGPLEVLLADDRVTEIMVSGPDCVHVEVDGHLSPCDVRFRDADHLRAGIERLVATSGRRLDEATPTVDAVLPDGSRLNAVLPPVAVGGPHLTIRRPPSRCLDFHDLVRCGSIPRPLAALLHAAVAGRCNLLVSGGTGAGKTTLLASLCALVPQDQRLVTIEDVAELRIDHPHVAAQQCRESPSPGVPLVDMRALVRNTLRMRPDRIVVGEVRGAEAADMVAAMNTGHPGSMSTVHANSATDALSRIEAMLAIAWPGLSMLTLRAWVFAALDMVVHCERGADGMRSVAQVVAMGDSGPEVVFDASRSDPPQVRCPPDRCLDRMARHGVDFAPELLGRPHVA
jgi:pilus assembly protein CpaF